MKRRPVLILPFRDLAEMESWWQELQCAGMGSAWHGPDEALDLPGDGSGAGDGKLYKCERRDDGTP